MVQSSSVSPLSSKQTLSYKLSSSRYGKEPRSSTRKRRSIASETSHSTAASSSAMPVATPISPQQPFTKEKATMSSDQATTSRRRRSSVSRDRKVEQSLSFSSDSVANFESVEWEEPTTNARPRGASASTERRSIGESKSGKKSTLASSSTVMPTSVANFNSVGWEETDHTANTRSRDASASRERRSTTESKSDKKSKHASSSRGMSNSEADLNPIEWEEIKQTSNTRSKDASASRDRRSTTHSKSGKKFAHPVVNFDTVGWDETDHPDNTRSRDASASRERRSTTDSKSGKNIAHSSFRRGMSNSEANFDPVGWETAKTRPRDASSSRERRSTTESKRGKKIAHASSSKGMPNSGANFDAMGWEDTERTAKTRPRDASSSRGRRSTTLSNSVANVDPVKREDPTAKIRSRESSASRERRSTRESKSGKKAGHASSSADTFSSSVRRSSRGRSRRTSPSSYPKNPPLPTPKAQSTTRQRPSSSKSKRSVDKNRDATGASPEAQSNTRKRSSSSKGKRLVDKSREKRSSSSKSKPKRSSSQQEQSLTSFMKKEDSIRPKESEENLEVKSAYTSVSLSRNRNKTIVTSSLHDSWSFASLHGKPASRNTRSFRDMMAAKAALGQKEDHREPPSGRSKSGERKQKASASSSMQRNLPEGVPEGSFRQHQSFASLPVLPEEAKKSRNSSKSRKPASQSRSEKSSGISCQELSDFLDQCHETRKQQKENNSEDLLSSPVSGDRSCVSMPALTSTSSIEKARRQADSKLSRKLKEATVSRLDHSPRSIQTTRSDPWAEGAANTSRCGPLIETAGEKGRRSSSRIKSRSRQENQSSKSLMKDSRSGSSESRLRSSSAGKELKMREEKGEMPGSLSRSRQSSQIKTESLSRSKSPGRRGSRRPGLQKLFSIRDLKSEVDVGIIVRTPLVFQRADTESAWAPKSPSKSQRGGDSIGVGEMGTAPPPPLVLQRKDTESAWTPLSPTNSQRGCEAVDDNFQPFTPLPPLSPHSTILPSTSLPSLSPHSPIQSERGLRSIDEGSGYLSIQARRFSESQSPASSVEEERNDVARNRWHSSHGHQPVSSLLKKKFAQPSGDDTGECQSERTIILCDDFEAALDEEADLGIEEDVFSHYTWASSGKDTIQVHGQQQEERKRLKDFLQESLLYKVFEAFEQFEE